MVVIATNQAGIARGYFREEDMISFNQAMKEKLAEDGVHIDAIYFCPHHPQEGKGEFMVDCDCRKPRPGMLIKAKAEMDIDPEQSFLVGDNLSDIEAAKRFGCMTVMVKTGQGTEKLKNNQIESDHVADDLYDAVEHILSLS
jgi:D-glycero-D-manno-heptose 1,7-bisphosphate phosphatase